MRVRTIMRWIGSWACAVTFAGTSVTGARAQDNSAGSTTLADAPFRYFENYVGGYDRYYGDDWFYDFYTFYPEGSAPRYDYYDDYDHATDVFAWEESGLFD